MCLILIHQFPAESTETVESTGFCGRHAHWPSLSSQPSCIKLVPVSYDIPLPLPNLSNLLCVSPLQRSFCLDCSSLVTIVDCFSLLLQQLKHSAVLISMVTLLEDWHWNSSALLSRRGGVESGEALSLPYRTTLSLMSPVSAGASVANQFSLTPWLLRQLLQAFKAKSTGGASHARVPELIYWT